MEESKVIAIVDGNRTGVALRLLAPALKIIVNQKEMHRSAQEDEWALAPVFSREDGPTNDHSRFVEANAPHNRNKRRSRRK